MDKITQRLCATFFGTAAIIFAVAFLIRSASPAQADNSPETTYSTGKYQMALSSIVTSNNSVVWYVLVWNTETGYSKFYSGTPQKGTTAAASQFNLPSSPL